MHGDYLRDRVLLHLAGDPVSGLGAIACGVVILLAIVFLGVFLVGGDDDEC